MEFSFEETPESRSQESGDNQYHELVYAASGEFDDFTVHNYALSLTPLTVMRPSGLLYRTSVRVEPNGFKNYIVRATYGKKDRNNTPVGSYTFSFDTTGGTANRKVALQHMGSWTKDGPDADDNHGGSIMVTENGVEGVDVVIPALKLSVTVRQPQGVVTQEYVKKLAQTTGKMNSAPFLEFAAGEMLFTGASGSDGSEAEAEVTYNFVIESNETLTLGDIAGIPKLGHELIWVEFRDEVVNGRACQVPDRVNVERVYPAADFAEALGWS